MTREEAVRILKDGGDFYHLAEAIGIVADERSPLAEIMLGLKYSGYVQQQAALALHARTGLPLRAQEPRVITDIKEWKPLIVAWETANSTSQPAETARQGRKRRSAAGRKS
jgi:hypothetical protein